ncbi:MULTISPECIES: cupin domain-containing protein [Thioalkalivibrio]|uniref:cupin domain-containing protein n=1 Tax=Thioalkalivibrio TaxID=106633 RepID=UPI0003681F47|nr:MULTISPECIES: cupin domain-containing protein [Thioalkalivibrio]
MNNPGFLARTRAAISLTAFTLLVLLATPLAHADPDPITAKPLTERHAFSGEVSMQITQELDGLPRKTFDIEDASNVSVFEFTIQPGAVFPWHTHPGTVLIMVTEGEFVFMFAEDCVRRELEPGMALVDPGDSVHTAYNPSRDEPTVVIATLLGVPGEGPLTMPVDADDNSALDEKCGIERTGENRLHGH